MAMQAASNAATTAAATASGAAAAAAPAAFMAVGAQIALVVGLMAVVAAAVTSGVVVSANRAESGNGPGDVPLSSFSPSLSPSVMGTPLVSDDCEVDSDIVTGGIIIFMDGLIRPLNDTELSAVEAGFVDVYNSLSGGCNDIYQRFMQSAAITNQTLISFSNGTSYLDTQWNASVRCSGCEESSNPFFDDDTTDNFVRFLQTDASAEANKCVWTTRTRSLAGAGTAFPMETHLALPPSIQPVGPTLPPAEPPSRPPSLGDSIFRKSPRISTSPPSIQHVSPTVLPVGMSLGFDTRIQLFCFAQQTQSPNHWTLYNLTRVTDSPLTRNPPSRCG